MITSIKLKMHKNCPLIWVTTILMPNLNARQMFQNQIVDLVFCKSFAQYKTKHNFEPDYLCASMIKHLQSYTFK